MLATKQPSPQKHPADTVGHFVRLYDGSPWMVTTGAVLAVREAMQGGLTLPQLDRFTSYNRASIRRILPLGKLSIGQVNDLPEPEEREWFAKDDPGIKEWITALVGDSSQDTGHGWREAVRYLAEAFIKAPELWMFSAGKTNVPGVGLIPLVTYSTAKLYLQHA